MKFELCRSFIGEESIPSLIISAADFLSLSYKGKDEKKLQKIDDEYNSFSSIISMYTAYCGQKMFIPSAVLHRMLDSVDKDGDIVINCIEAGEIPEFCCRWISHGKETYLDFKLMPIGG